MKSWRKSFDMATSITNVLAIRQVIPGDHSACLIESDYALATVVVSGSILEAQFEIDDGYILFLSEDRPFEERLHIYLLDESLGILDHVTIFQIYTLGIFGDAAIGSDRSISFTFFSKDDRFVVETVMRRAFYIGPRQMKLRVRNL